MNPAPIPLQSIPLRTANGGAGTKAQAAVEGLSAPLGATAEVVMHEVDRGGMKGAEGSGMQGLGKELNRRVGGTAGQ